MKPCIEHSTRRTAQDWQQQLDSGQAEIDRSERVQQQLKTILGPLQQRLRILEAETQKLREDVASPTAFCERLQQQAVEATDARAVAEDGRNAVFERFAEGRAELAEAEARLHRVGQEVVEAGVIEASHREGRSKAELSCVEARERARSMVHVDALERARAEAVRARGSLSEQEAETLRLREALADSWATRHLEPETGGFLAGEGQLEAIESLEDDLNHLADMQKQAALESHRVQKLERTEVALQRRLIAASEEKASLQSERMDLGLFGSNVREAMASTCERHVDRVSSLEEGRRLARADCGQLARECADLQSKRDKLGPDLEKTTTSEQARLELEASVAELAAECERLRAMNGGLSNLMLSSGAVGMEMCDGDVPDDSTTESLRKLLQLNMRFMEREAAHHREKQLLVDKLRSFEQTAASDGGSAPASGAASGDVSSNPANFLSAGKKVFRTGLGKLF